MHIEDAFSAAHVWRGNNHNSVESARSQQCPVEHVGPIRSGDHHDAGALVKAVHLHEDLIECLLALVIGVAQTRSTLTTDGVNFVDEDDARGTFASFVEQIAYTTGADADEHLDEFGSRDPE